MTQIFKFLSVIIIFLFIFIIVTNGKFNFAIYFKNLILIFHFSLLNLCNLTPGIVVGVIICQSNRQCRKEMTKCFRPKHPKCVSGICKCWY